MRKIILPVIALATGSLLYTAPALAQGAAAGSFGGMQISSQSSGATADQTPGVRLGETFIMHAALAVGAGVDSNVFYEDRATTSSAMLRVLPSVTLSNAGRGTNPNIAFSIGVNGDYRRYLSDDPGVDAQSDAFGVGVGAALDIGNQRTITATIFNNFVRDVQASYAPGSREFVRDVEQAGLRLRWSPGGGRLEEYLTYSATYDHFESGLAFADSIEHQVDFRSNFKFLPKTALYLGINQRYIHYLEDTSGKSDSKPFRAQVGIQGLITPKLTLSFGIGYGYSFYEVGPNASTVVMATEINYLIGPFAQARIGYEHNFVNSVFGNYYDMDAVYAGWNQLLGRRFVATLITRFEHRSYKCQPNAATANVPCYQNVDGSDRVDNWLSLGITAAYRPKAWLAIGASYHLLANVSDFQLLAPMGSGMMSVPNRAEFMKHQVMGLVTISY